MSLIPKGWKPLASERRLNTTATESSWFLRLESLDGTRSMLFNPQEAADIIGAEMDRRAERIKGADEVTTGKDYGLPEEYADWVEVGAAPKQGRSINVLAMEFRDGLAVNHIYSLLGGRWFAEPKPKPTLPDVKPGAVVRYTDHAGDTVRVMKLSWGDKWWCDIHDSTYSDSTLLADVDDDGFTVELEGL